METLWDVANEGGILFADELLEKTSAVLSSCSEFEYDDDGDSTRFFGCVSCQEVARVCIFCHDCIRHHKRHKFYPLSKIDSGHKCRCCERNHACENIAFSAHIPVLDAPHPESGETPIYIASKNNHKNFICKLINMNCNINALNTNGENALFGALQGDVNLEIVDYLIDRGIHTNQISFISSYGPLHKACAEKDSFDLMEKFCRKQSRIDLTLLTADGHTPLTVAARKLNILTMEYLLRRGAPPSFSGNPHLSKCLQSLHVLALLLEYGGKLKRGVLEPIYESFSSNAVKISYVEGLFRIACALEHPYLWDFVFSHNFNSMGTVSRFNRVNCLSDSVLLSPVYTDSSIPIEIALDSCLEKKKQGKEPSFFIVNQLLHQHVPISKISAKLMKYGLVETWVEFINSYRTEQGVLDLENAKISYLSPNFMDALRFVNSGRQKFVQTLNLQSNKLQTIPVELGHIPQLVNVLLKDNPLLTNNMLSVNWKEVKSQLKEVEDRSKQWNRYKVVLLGHQTGVRFLWKKLSTEKKKHIFRNSKAVGASFLIQKDVQIAKNTPVCDIWRLQGSHVGYFPSVSLYLTRNSVFLLSVYVADLIGDTADMELANLNCWFQSISALSKHITSIPVIIALFEDQRGLAADTQQVANFVMQRFQMYKFISAITIISAKFEGIENVKEQIVNLHKRVTPKVKDSSWVLLYDLITSLLRKTPKKQANTQVITELLHHDSASEFHLEWKQFLRFANACLVKDPRRALKFLACSGAVLAFQLQEPFIILNPLLLECYVRDLQACTGMFYENKVSEYWPTLPSVLHQRMVSLFLLHSIFFPVQYQKNPVQTNGRALLMPSTLPSEIDGGKLRLEWDNKDQYVEYEYHRIYQLFMVPADFIGRVFVELLHIPDIKLCLLWKNGLILSYTLNTCPCSSYPCEQRAFIKFHSEGGHRIRVTTRCCHVSHRLLRMVASTIYNLVEDLKLTNCITRLVPCTHCIRNKFSNIFRFAYEECIDQVACGKQHVYCSHIKSNFRRTAISSIAPDINFASIPKIRSSQLIVEQLLGEGGFGKVYKATYLKNKDTKITVAVKQPHENLEDPTGLAKYDPTLYDEFMKEVQIMREVRHPNIVELIGVAFQPLRMVLEFVGQGDLFDLLHKSDQEISWRLRLLIAWDIAKGMRVLQAHVPPIVHRDLHAHNIFISSLSEKTSEQRAKVADFGLARGVVRAASFALSDIWLAPEILSGNSYDCTSDVYSYAICCWQIATRKIPFSMANVPFLRDAIVNEHVRPSVDVLFETDAPKEFIELIIQCWNPVPQERPDFNEIVETLQQLLDIRGVPYSLDAVMRGSLTCIGSKSTAKLSISDDSVMYKQTKLHHSIDIAEIIGKQMTVTCAIKLKNNFWLGTTRGDIVTIDIASCKLVATKKAHSQAVLRLLHVPSKGSLVVSCTNSGHVRVWKDQEMVKETSLSKCIKDCKLVSLSSRKVGVAFICIDNKGKSSISYYSIQHLSENATNTYDNLPVVGFQSDVEKTSAVYLLHTDGKISMRVYRSLTHDYLSKIDQFQFGDQPTPLCPSLSVSFGGKSFFCIADCEKIHKYSFLEKEDQSVSITSQTVEYFNAPIYCLELVSSGTVLTRKEVENCLIWSGHHNGLITIWSFKRNPINEEANFVELHAQHEIDKSISPHKSEIVSICQAEDKVYSFSRDGIIGCWAISVEPEPSKKRGNFDFRKSVRKQK